MNRPLFSFLLFAGAVLAVPVARANADESSDVAVKIKAPLDSTACTATPPTISVLTLNIDVTTASFDSEDDEAGGCSSLSPGSTVEVELGSDSVPLEAVEVSQEGDDEDEDGASIQAPVQAVDATAKTITVLGLTVDASNAALEGEDDDDDEGAGQPVDLSQITVGQVLEIHLDRSQLPSLVATQIEIKNFTNQVSVTVDDDQGQEIDDSSDDVSVDVTETVLVKQKVAGKIKTVKQTIHQQFQTHGSFVLSGLPKGNAKVNVVRTVNGVQTAGRRTVHVAPNRIKPVKMRLHQTRH